MTQKIGPVNRLNRVNSLLDKALKELQEYRGEFPPDIVEQANSMFLTDFQNLAAFDAADVVSHLIRHLQKQICEIKRMYRPRKSEYTS